MAAARRQAGQSAEATIPLSEKTETYCARVCARTRTRTDADERASLNAPGLCTSAVGLLATPAPETITDGRKELHWLREQAIICIAGKERIAPCRAEIKMWKQWPVLVLSREIYSGREDCLPARRLTQFSILSDPFSSFLRPVRTIASPLDLYERKISARSSDAESDFWTASDEGFAVSRPKQSQDTSFYNVSLRAMHLPAPTDPPRRLRLPIFYLANFPTRRFERVAEQDRTKVVVVSACG